MANTQQQIIAKILVARIIQTKRLLLSVGLVRVALLLAIIVFILNSCYKFFMLFPASIIIVSLLLAFVTNGIRRDKEFLLAIVVRTRLLFFIEYSLICLVIFVLSFFTPAWHYLPICLVGIYGITLLKIKPVSFKRIRHHKWLHHTNIEWITGLRRYPVIFVFYAAALLTVFLPYASLLLIWIAMFIVNSFYEYNEPLSLLTASHNGKQLIAQKIKHLTRCYLLPTVLTIALYTIFNPQHWLISATFTVVSMFCLITTIYVKYAFYTPNRTPGIVHIIQPTVICSCIIFPLLILTATICYIYRKRAFENLNYYLNDNN